MSDDFGKRHKIACQNHITQPKIMQKKIAFLLLCVIGLAWSAPTDVTSKAVFVNAQQGWRLSNGNIQHTTDAGKSWGVSYQSNKQAINDLHFLTPTDGWAVGDEALVLHWDGEKWEEIFVFATAALRDVHFSGTDYGWAVGDRGTILHWNGISWVAFPCPLDESLVKIEHNEAGNMRIVSSKGTLVWRQGGEWQILTPTSGESTAQNLHEGNK